MSLDTQSFMLWRALQINWQKIVRYSKKLNTKGQHTRQIAIIESHNPDLDWKKNGKKSDWCKKVLT